jgi:SulP family sulfate permease
MPNLSNHRLTDIALGLTAGVALVLTSAPLAALVFSGPLNNYLPFGIITILFGGAVTTIVTALFSRIPNLLSSIQSTPLALVGGIFVGLEMTYATASNTQILLSTTIAVIALTSFGIASILVLFRDFRLTNLVQFIPYPVFCGFLAGVGWILIQSSIRIAAGLAFQNQTVSTFLTSEIPWQVGCTVLVGLLIFCTMQRLPSPLVMPTLLTLVIAIFYGLVIITGQNLADLRARGWIYGPFDSNSLDFAIQNLSWSAIDWQIIVDHLDAVAAILFVNVVTSLISMTSLEVALQQELDIHHELNLMSVNSLFTSLLGTSSVGPHVSLTCLFAKNGAKNRMFGITSGIVLLIAAIFGTQALNYVPKMALAAIVLLTGVSLLYDWLFKTYQRLTHSEYLIIIGIFLTVCIFGFLQAVALGIAICATFFLLKYSSISFIKSEATGAERHSDVDRSQAELTVLTREGNRLIIAHLEGYLFFGTASRLYKTVRSKVRMITKRPAYLVLGFLHVSGLDSSTISALIKLRQLAEKEDVILILTEVNPRFQAQFYKNDLIQGSYDPRVLIFQETDFGIEWAEDQLIREAGLYSEAKTIDKTLVDLMSGDSNAVQLLPYLERLELRQGEYLYHQGEPGQDVYFIEKGYLALVVKTASDMPLRLRKSGPGTVVGQLDVYDGTPRDADAIAEEDCIVWRLSTEKLRDLEWNSPQEALIFHQMMARMMSYQVGYLSDELRRVYA